MRGRPLLGSKRLRCPVSILTYFPHEVFSFPFFWSLVIHFEDEMFLKREDFVTPRPRVRCTVHGTVGAYTNTKCHIVIFWRCNDNLLNPECCNRIRVQLLFRKKG